MTIFLNNYRLCRWGTLYLQCYHSVC